MDDDKYYNHKKRQLRKLGYKGKQQETVFRENKDWYDLQRRALSDPNYKAQRRKEQKEYRKESGQGSAALRRYRNNALKNKQR